MRSVAVWALVIAVSAGSSSPLAYLKLGAEVNGRVVDATWKRLPIGYFISTRPGNGVSVTDLAGAVERVQLTDYKVRIIDSRSGTAARTRVIIQSGDGAAEWGTVGVNDNIVEASLQALVDSLEFALIRKQADVSVGS